MAQKTAIPVGTQFSPDLVELPAFLAALVKHSGDRGQIRTAFWSPPVHKKRHGVPPSHRTAELPLEAAMAYGLLDRGTHAATDLAKKLAQMGAPQVFEEFARHILLNRGGLRVLDGVQEMQIEGQAITGDSLANYLSTQGFPVTPHNTAINSLRMWLAKAGVFSATGWDVDLAAKERLVGLSDQVIGILTGFDHDQRAFLEALCRLDPQGWCKAADVRDLAETTTGRKLGRQSLPKQFLEPLKAAGLIDYKSGGTSGGKSAQLKVTPKFQKDVLTPFMEVTIKTLDSDVVAYFKMRPADIHADLNSTDKFKKGQALEAFAIHVMRILGLRFLAWRKRAKDTTGRAEVDAFLSGIFGAVPTRWQVQCKNTPAGRLELEDVAKEVGLLPVTHATHILILANCKPTKDALEFAGAINRKSHATVFVLGKDSFDAIKANPGSLGGILREKAELILRSQPKELWTPQQ